MIKADKASWVMLRSYLDNLVRENEGAAKSCYELVLMRMNELERDEFEDEPDDGIETIARVLYDSSEPSECVKRAVRTELLSTADDVTFEVMNELSKKRRK